MVDKSSSEAYYWGMQSTTKNLKTPLAGFNLVVGPAYVVFKELLGKDVD